MLPRGRLILSREPITFSLSFLHLWNWHCQFQTRAHAEWQLCEHIYSFSLFRFHYLFHPRWAWAFRQGSENNCLAWIQEFSHILSGLIFSMQSTKICCSINFHLFSKYNKFGYLSKVLLHWKRALHWGDASKGAALTQKSNMFLFPGFIKRYLL